MTRKALCLLSLLLALAVGAAASTVIFSDFGPGDSYNTGVGYTLAGPHSPNCCQSSAVKYEPG
jgi:hypothetical protein